MAHFAQLDENNVVMHVYVVNNQELMVDGVESEEKGIEFLKTLFGENTVWKQTSYNRRFRKHYASAGFIYIPDIDAFVHPQPYPSWTLNNETARWEAPIAMPDDGQHYTWNEGSQIWELTVSGGNNDGT